MKKIMHMAVLAFFCGACGLFSLPAAAQDMPSLSIGPQQTTEPAVTDSATIAMVFARLTGHAPDFSGWARQTEAYKNASPFEQPTIEKNEVQQMQDAFGALDTTAPLIVKTQVQLSPYDANNHGFFVINFKKSTFFPARYAGKFYAIVPQGIMDKQWLPVSDAATRDAIEKAAAGSKGGQLPMILYLTPSYADTKPAMIDGYPYWPLAVTVSKVMLFSADNQTLLWHDYSSDDKTRQSIMNLYQ